MAQIIIHPTQDPWAAQRAAESRGCRLEIRGDRLVEVVPQARRRKFPNKEPNK